MQVNAKRQIEFDYAKTLAIFFMVIIHVVEEMSHVEFEALPAGFWENCIQFGAGPLAAPVFVFSMGMGIVFSQSQEPEQIFKRGIKLLIAVFIPFDHRKMEQRYHLRII